MEKSVYKYTSYTPGYHVGYGHAGYEGFTFEWYNSRGLIDSLSEDVPNVATLTAVRKQAYYQLSKNKKITSIDIVKYGSRKMKLWSNLGYTKYIADYVGTVTNYGYGEIKWVDATGKWYNLKKDGTLGTLIKTRHSKETPMEYKIQ